MERLLLCITLLDQITKRACDKLFYWNINSHLTLHTVWNKGVGFSLLENLDPLIIIAFTTIMIVCLLLLFYKTTRLLDKLALSFIIGGAVGNLIDRIIYNKVCDFIILNIQNYTFPVCNLADISITIGGFLLFIGYFYKKKHK